MSTKGNAMTERDAARQRLERLASSTATGYAVAVMDAYGSEPIGQLYTDLRALLDAKGEVVTMRAALAEAAKAFRRYEASHNAKGTVEGCQKAAANSSLARTMEAALNTGGGDE
jgi:predicted exporter